MSKLPKSGFWWGIFAGLILVTFFNFSLVSNIGKPVGFDYADDTYHVYFIIKHYINVYTTGNWSSLPTLPMFYGTKNSLFFLDSHTLQGLLALPIYLLTHNIIITSHILMLLTLYTSFLTTYLLAWYFTRGVFPSLLAGIIYLFNPFISDWIPGYLLLFSLQWTPLILLLLEIFLKKPNSRYGFLFFLFLMLKLLGTSLYYSIFFLFLLPIYVFVRIWQEKIKPVLLINKGIIIGFFLFIVVALVNSYFYLQVFTFNPPNRGLIESEYFYSAWAANWFFTSNTNILYGGLKDRAIQKAPNLFPLKDNEQNLFWGIFPSILFLYGFKILRNSESQKLWLAWLIMLGLSMLMAFGPVIHITNNISFPGLYSLVYAIDPLFRFTRVPARFGAFVFLFLALILAITLKELNQRLKPHPLRNYLFTIMIILLILFEYRNYPLKFIDFPKSTKNFYAFLNSQNQIHEIIDLPIANRLPASYPSARVENADADYYIYGSIFHDKVMFNGYSSFMPDEFNKRAMLISLDFPSFPKLELLKKWGVGGIILHKDEFKKTEYFDSMKTELVSQGVPLIQETDTLALFDLTKWPK